MKVCTISKEETQALAKELLRELDQLGCPTPKLGVMLVGLRGDLAKEGTFHLPRLSA